MFNFVANKKWFFMFSIAIVVIAAISFFIQGFNFDIDFTGGTQIRAEINKEFDNDTISGLVEDIIGEKPSIQKSTNPITGENTDVVIKTRELSAAERTEIYSILHSYYSIDIENGVSSDNISSAVGSDLKSSAIWASLIAVLLMMIYIAFRFEFTTAIATIIALLHDILILIAVYTLFQIPVNLTFIAAVLTVLGYSTNDTIVLFDRIRENLKGMKKVTIAEVVNASIWQTMRRTIFTTSTTLLVIVLLYILGVPSIREFALPLMIGIGFGIYSTIFIAAQLWVLFVGGENRKA